jgi:hypothetical protein
MDFTIGDNFLGLCEKKNILSTWILSVGGVVFINSPKRTPVNP